jgi:predicted YcjX-like family ATPase
MITDEKIAELDEVIAQEKRVAAREMQSEAWADGMMEGIETEILADAAIATALEELIRTDGESSALLLVDNLRDRIIAGEFIPERTLQ